MSSILQSIQRAIIIAYYFLTANLFQQPHLAPDSNPSPRAMKHIVIVGGSFGGVRTAHRFLKQAAKVPASSFKVTLISRDSHFYWNIAAPRGLLPGQISDEQLFQPIAPGFAHYQKGQVEFLLASATGIDIDGKKLEIVSHDGKVSTIEYNYLVLATGSRTRADTPFKSMGSTEATKEALHELQEQINNAENIVIIGGGATGIETAGEIAFEYGQDKKVALISSGRTILEGRPAKVSQTAEKLLEALNVDLRLNAKIKDIKQLPNGTQELNFSNGKKLVADLVIPTYGVLPNSSFIPSQFLNADGFIQVDETLQVIGAKDVFAIGDVSNLEPPQFMFVERQSIHMAKNIVFSINGTPLTPYKASATAMIGLQIGKKSGTGHWGNFKLPAFLVLMIRKTLFIEDLPKTVDGSML
ncbi:apoptosis-inducing factor 2 [Trichoderma arundinaceum]|uniref:Apoptosis-inducing factor 2 n=1 Tax=Trichoderma arundinaceum TaxID=490622 RepID=A0A395NXT8_TRIAR|nr:apoptosis-inducing factor 2 [Trichoderma arundinaceum]